MRLDALAGAIAADDRRGRIPFFVAASAGSTNTGAIDPLPQIAAICREAGAWLHIDAAYGGFAALTERGRRWLDGLEQADSVTLDPHKWLYQPFECGCVLIRDGDRLRTAFEVVPDYLKDAQAHAGEVNFSDLGFQLTRSSRALKLWLSLSYFGVDAFRAAIDRSLDLTAQAERLIRERPDARADLARPARDRLLPATLRRGRGGVAVGPAERGAGRAIRAERVGPGVLDHARTGATRSGCASSTTRRPKPTSSARSTGSRVRRSRRCPTRPRRWLCRFRTGTRR